MIEEFCLTDLWGAEAFLTFLDANEPVGIEMLLKGIKIHNWLEDIVKEKFPEAVKAADYTYKSAKQNIHSMNYGIRPPHMSRECGLPLNICEWIYAYYHKTFPGIRMRMERIQQELQHTHSLTSLLGRKRMFFAPWGDDLFKEAYAWPSQSCIGEITNIAMTKLYYLGQSFEPWMFPALNTHDGLAIRCYKGNRQAVRQRVIEAFDVPLTRWGITLRIPIEIGWGDNFNDMTEKEVYFYGNH